MKKKSFVSNGKVLRIYLQMVETTEQTQLDGLSTVEVTERRSRCLCADITNIAVDRRLF